MPGRPTRQRVAVITGGGRGIGLALAKAFVHEAYAVVITGRDQKRLSWAAEDLAKGGADVTALGCDVRDPQSVEKLFSSVRQRFSAIDVLVNNAGIAGALCAVDKLRVEAWKEIIDTNLTGTFLVTHAALPLIRAGGTIVNNLSVAAEKVFAGMSAYCSSKAGALGFTNVLREELRSRGIRVLALLPGTTNTEIFEQFWPDAPRSKMIAPETVAAAVLHAVLAPANATIEEIRMGPVVGAL
jgi:NAD(P)-dependent dehydrogenase (short-subunit alcohol dehydrogenase family)